MDAQGVKVEGEENTMTATESTNTAEVATETTTTRAAIEITTKAMENRQEATTNRIGIAMSGERTEAIIPAIIHNLSNGTREKTTTGKVGEKQPPTTGEAKALDMVMTATSAIMAMVAEALKKPRTTIVDQRDKTMVKEVATEKTTVVVVSIRVVDQTPRLKTTTLVGTKVSTTATTHQNNAVVTQTRMITAIAAREATKNMTAAINEETERTISINAGEEIDENGGIAMVITTNMPIGNVVLGKTQAVRSRVVVTAKEVTKNPDARSPVALNVARVAVATL